MSAFSSTEDLCAHCYCALVYKCWKSFNQEQQTKMLYHDSDIGVLFQFNCSFNLYISGLLLSWLKIIHSRMQIKSQSYICNNNTWSSCTCLKWSLIFYQPWFCIAKRQSLQNMPITRHTYAETDHEQIYCFRDMKNSLHFWFQQLPEFLRQVTISIQWLSSHFDCCWYT